MYSAYLLTALWYFQAVISENGDHKLTSIVQKPIPDHFDWRDRGAVSPVKDQSSCAACWAFSITGAIESQVKIHQNKEVLLSEQFLIDCIEENNGCEPASILNTFSIIVTEIGGILQEQDYYEYKSRKMQCRWQQPIKNNTVASPHTISGFNKNLTQIEKGNVFTKNSTLFNKKASPVPVIGMKRVLNDEDAMAEMIYKHGPVTAAINSASMDVYTNGIDEPDNEKCNPSLLDHTVLIVGYSAYVSNETRVPYWIIKNSWGDNWGDSGFYYLVRGRNACGIASDVVIGFVE